MIRTRDPDGPSLVSFEGNFRASPADVEAPHNPSSGRRSPGDEALEKAVVALQMKRPDEAERLAAGVLRADRSNHIAAKVLGWALLAQGRAGEAIQPVERAARRSNDPEIETVLAVALAATVRQQEALDQLRQMTARRPAFAPAFREYAGQLAKLDRLDEAIEMIKGGIAPVCLACRCKRDEIQRCHANLRGNNSRCSLREIFRGRSITPG